MKKLTIQQFAQTIRNKRPGKYDDLNDNDLVFKWLKTYYADSKYIEPNELAKLGYNEVGKLVSKGKDYVTDKLGGQAAVDSTIQKVKDNVTNVIDKVKNTSSTSPKPTQTVDPSVFNCIRNSRGWGSKLTSKSDEANAYSFLNDVQSEFVFFGDGKFYIQLNSGEKMFGTWKCKGQSSYEIEIDNTDFNKKQYFRSETGQWADHQNAEAIKENFIKKIVTKHLRSKL